MARNKSNVFFPRGLFTRKNVLLGILVELGGVVTLVLTGIIITWLVTR